MAVPIKKGVEYDCPMFDVRCKQPCVSNGLRQISKCPYDNYNSSKIPVGYQGHYAKNSSTLIMATRVVNANSTGIPPKGANSMANTKNNSKPVAPATGNGNNGFQPTFRRYQDMSDTEKAAFRQGAKTSENKVKERLGFVKPKN